MWDHAHRQGPSPKDMERSRRDAQSLDPTHEHLDLDLSCPCPKEWSKVIGCRSCKSHLIHTIAHTSLELMAIQDLADGQTFVTAGGFRDNHADQAWEVGLSSSIELVPHLTSNHEEADTRVWCNAKNFSHVVIYSPDTDTTMIGLGLIDDLQSSILLKVDMPGSARPEYVDLNHLADAIRRDTDLAAAPEQMRIPLVQIVFVASGCDFVSFFSGLGKTSFFKALYANCTFITSTADESLQFILWCLPPTMLSTVLLSIPQWQDFCKRQAMET